MNREGKFYITVNYEGMPPLKNGLQAQYLPLEEGNPWQFLQRIMKLLRLTPSAKVMLLDSTVYADLFAAIAIGFMPRRFRPYLVLWGDMWQKDGGIRGLIEKIIITLADRSIHRYALLSPEELTLFPHLWNIDPAKGRCCSFFYTLIDSELNELEEFHADEDYIFAGGNAHRDYDSLLEAARRMPHRKFIIATRRQFPDVPPNVEIKSVEHEEFIHLMKGARLMVTPIKSGLTRSVGQQTYLNAMRLGKVSIVNNNQVLGIKEYIEDKKNGLLADGTVEGYITAIEWVLDPANKAAVEAIQQAAKQSARDRFTYERYIKCLAGVIDELLETEASTTLTNS